MPLSTVKSSYINTHTIRYFHVLRRKKSITADLKETDFGTDFWTDFRTDFWMDFQTDFQTDFWMDQLIIDSCSSHSDSLISLSYSITFFSMKSIRLFFSDQTLLLCWRPASWYWYPSLFGKFCCYDFSSSRWMNVRPRKLHYFGSIDHQRNI